MAKNIDKGEVLVYTIGLVRKSVTKENEMKSCCILLWTLLLILCLVGSPVFAEGILDTEVTCTFTNKDLAEIVANLQTQAKIDIALDPAISQSKISLDLGKTTLGTVLDQIILKTGAFYRQVGEKSLIIASLNPKGIYFADISETEIVLIKFSLVEQVMALLANNSLLQYAVADKASNQISITAPRPIINRLKAEIAKIDVEPLSMSFELSVLDTTKSELKDAGFQLALTNAKPNSNGVSTFTFQNTIVGFTNPYAALQLFHYFAGNNVKNVCFYSCYSH